MKVSVPVIVLSTSVIIFLFTIFSFFIVWLFFPVEKPADSFKDALNFSASLFGGASTLGAAIIAALLFSDWSEIKKAETASTICLQLINLTSDVDSLFNEIKIFMPLYKKRGSDYIDTKFDEKYKKINNLIKSIQKDSSFFSQFALSTEKEIYKKYLGVVLTYSQTLLLIETAYKQQLDEKSCTDFYSTNSEYETEYKSAYEEFSKIIFKYYLYQT